MTTPYTPDPPGPVLTADGALTRSRWQYLNFIDAAATRFDLGWPIAGRVIADLLYEQATGGPPTVPALRAVLAFPRRERHALAAMAVGMVRIYFRTGAQFQREVPPELAGSVGDFMSRALPPARRSARGTRVLTRMVREFSDRDLVVLANLVVQGLITLGATPDDVCRATGAGPYLSTRG